MYINIYIYFVHSVDRRVLFFYSYLFGSSVAGQSLCGSGPWFLGSLVPWLLGSLVPWFSLSKLLCSRVGTFSLSETSACVDTSFSCTSEWSEIPLVGVAMRCYVYSMLAVWSVYVGESELLIKVQAPWLKLLIFEADF